MGRPPGGVGINYTVSLFLLPGLVLFLIYLFGCERHFLLDSVLLINNFSINSHNFGVFMGGSELRVFLLYHFIYAFRKHILLVNQIPAFIHFTLSL